MDRPTSGDVDVVKREADYRLAVGDSKPIPVPAEPPERHCDVIMKGGITSGVVYPKAGVELAARYTLKSIGGTSAGAIAAGLFAAAEHRRSAGGSPQGFEDLRGYPDKFGTMVDSRTSYLQALFRPVPGMQRLFRLVIAFLEKNKLLRAGKVLWAVLRGYPHSLLGLVPGVLLLILGRQSSDELLRILAIVFGIPAAVLGFLVVATGFVAGQSIGKLSRHKFGMCPGSGDPAPGHPRPLSDWIEENLNLIAFGPERWPSEARPPGYEPGDPLTFGDLWGLRSGGDKRQLANDSRLRRINLEVMTTNLNQGRPYRLPIDSEHLYFDAKELEDVFSQTLLKFMTKHARPARNERGEHLHKIAAAQGLTPMPHPADLPVAVAVRLSLSFPLLISAVPLWCFDFTYEIPDRKGDKEEAKPTRCWFSDGGITSNFPIHFFDGPIPRWPTFGFNLTPFHKRFDREKQEALNIWLPNTNGDGSQETWCSPPEEGARKRLMWFLFQVVGTMQNWRDNLQLRIPGFRDRVAQIHQDDDEGGLNLNMEDTTIQALSDRGRIAAQILAERFSDSPPRHTVLDWDNHAWVRLRAAMGLLESHLARIEAAYTQKEGLRTYAHLIANPPPSYPFGNAVNAAVMLGELDAFARRWGTFSGLLGDAVPQPLADLRTVPKV